MPQMGSLVEFGNHVSSDSGREYRSPIWQEAPTICLLFDMALFCPFGFFSMCSVGIGEIQAAYPRLGEDPQVLQLLFRGQVNCLIPLDLSEFPLSVPYAVHNGLPLLAAVWPLSSMTMISLFLISFLAKVRSTLSLYRALCTQAVPDAHCLCTQWWLGFSPSEVPALTLISLLWRALLERLSLYYPI